MDDVTYFHPNMEKNHPKVGKNPRGMHSSLKVWIHVGAQKGYYCAYMLQNIHKVRA